MGNVDNTSDVNKPVSTAQAAAIAVVQSDVDAHEARTDNPHSVTKAQVGLGNVTNDAQIPLTQKGAASGVAELDGTGKVPASQLPSYVDDVLEYANFASLPITGETGKIYVTLDDNKTYRWGGSVYVEISVSLALGETSTTAYRGDRGKIAYDHSQTTGNPHGTTAMQIANTPAGNISAVTVQAAINELDTEKANLSGATFT